MNKILAMPRKSLCKIDFANINFANIIVYIAMLITLIVILGCKEKINGQSFGIEIVNPEALNQELFAEQKEATSVVFVTTGAWTSTITEGADSWVDVEQIITWTSCKNSSLET